MGVTDVILENGYFSLTAILGEKVMANLSKKAQDGGRGEPSELWKEFQSSVLSLMKNLPKAALEAVGDDPDALLIETTSENVQEAFKRVFKTINSAYESTSTLAKKEAADFLEVSNALNYVRSTEKVAVSAFKSKLFGGSFWGWLKQNIIEIKKIIGLLLDALGLSKIAEWWKKWETLIDEIIALLLSILGGIFGFNKVALAKEFSQREVNYHNEMAALERRLIVSRGFEPDDD